ncbi:glycine oxidase ThiO [Ghiorsea bivora]|uniref:glycine oxidase ThiO n=1 Tax=Ghiorsea bivora TaxID=1485545 RepID=UPI00056F35F1|nr:glycine oxidase ThiO [Ghiorsea bivora]
MKVVVIGAGLIGLLTALRLKQQGVDVVVLEKAEAASESSWAGAGILCPIHPWLYPDSFTDLVNASLDLYPELQAELTHETGHDIQRIQSGLLIPCFADDAVKHQSAAQVWSDKFDWEMQRLTPKQALDIEPNLSTFVEEALYWQDVYQVRNPELLKAVMLYLQKLGVEVIEHSEVAQLLEHETGSVCGVQTSQGQTYEADAVLLAAGSWSEKLAVQSGFDLHVKPVKGQIVLLKTKPGTLKHIVKHDDAYFVPRKDGRVLVGATMENVGFARGNTVEALSELLAATQRLIPSLKHAQVEQQWMGFRPGSPDGLPYLGKVSAKQGLWVATGHYRNGVALAPITAKVMADWICGTQPNINMDAFAPDRVVCESESVGYPQL